MTAAPAVEHSDACCESVGPLQNRSKRFVIRAFSWVRLSQCELLDHTLVSRLGSVTAQHLVVGVRQTLRHSSEGATYVQQGDHHVGHWPTFLVF